ncbi:hypothetical protein NGB36_15360 [Streptomyces sp. RB6PN25]|uniref:Secreted protein n=1 Tax=Streptomyces humicola TaxID=2953240 RepID=A0ABT1PWA2_9ACTN|nr:hypothetical protein [Streptomyces humicola]MCQ4081949.1 hypothetical protein [Streptomyces humicola]
MEAVLSVIALMFVLFVAAGLVVAVKTVRAVRRGVERTGTQARRVVEETALKAKVYTQAGPAGELASLRLGLRTCMVGTRQALEAGVASDPSLKEALGLLDRLRAHAHALDDELKLLEREPDRGRVEVRLPELRERTQRVTHSADSLRWAAQDRARQFADDELAALGREIEIEAGALRHWVPQGVTEPQDAAAQAELGSRDRRNAR